MRGCAARASIFGMCQGPRIPWVFQNPKRASTMKQICDDSTGGNNFGRARTVLTWRSDHCCDTFPSGDVLSNSSEKKRLCHVIPGSKFCVEHMSTPTKMMCCLRQEARSTTHVKQFLPSHAFVNDWICSRFVHNTSARIASASILFRSEQKREWCHQPRSSISRRVLKPRSQSMLAPLCRVWYIVVPLSPKASVGIENTIAAARQSKFQIFSSRFPAWSAVRSLLTR